MLAAQRLGFAVPARCAVLGFGDFPIAEALFLRLSTVRPPARDIGEIAASRVLAELGVLDPGETRAVPACALRRRESA
ncbi:MAG: substrate-binding domain-containing protein [Solimonas sp.]